MIYIHRCKYFYSECRGVGMDVSIFIVFIYTLLSFRKGFEVIDTSVDSDSGMILCNTLNFRLKWVLMTSSLRRLLIQTE